MKRTLQPVEDVFCGGLHSEACADRPFERRRVRRQHREISSAQGEMKSSVRTHIQYTSTAYQELLFKMAPQIFTNCWQTLLISLAFASSELVDTGQTIEDGRIERTLAERLAAETLGKKTCSYVTFGDRVSTLKALKAPSMTFSGRNAKVRRLSAAGCAYSSGAAVPARHNRTTVRGCKNASPSVCMRKVPLANP